MPAGTKRTFSGLCVASLGIHLLVSRVSRPHLQWSLPTSSAQRFRSAFRGQSTAGRLPHLRVRPPRPAGHKRVPHAGPAVVDSSPKRATTAVSTFVPLSTLLCLLVVLHKCVCDLASSYTRQTGIPYSAVSAAVIGECIKVPVVIVTVLLFEGGAGLRSALRSAVTDRPLQLAMPGFAYAIQNILYFQALSYISVAGYQLLSQTKLAFTAMLMGLLLKKRLTGKQLAAVALLTAGTVLTQLSEIPSGESFASSQALLGGGLTVLGALLSALPNVFYEGVLKRGKSQWACNMQLTFWIWFWLLVVSLPDIVRSLGAGGEALGAGGVLTGFTAMVWIVITLQSLKCVLIPATLKHADNIVYSYARPLSIVLTAAVAALFSGVVPSLQFLCGGGLVIASIILY